jgi:hypothetical protein
MILHIFINETSRYYLPKMTLKKQHILSGVLFATEYNVAIKICKSNCPLFSFVPWFLSKAAYGIGSYFEAVKSILHPAYLRVSS